MTSQHHKHPYQLLLLSGSLLLLLTGPRWGVAPLAWLVPVPFLLWARHAQGRRVWGRLFLAQLAGYAAQCAIFATTPVPVVGVIGFAPPLALIRFLPIVLAEFTRRRRGEVAGQVMFVAATVLADWLGYGVSEFGAWMATANSQVEWLAFTQLTAFAGLAGAGALMAWWAAALAHALSMHTTSGARAGRSLMSASGVVVVALSWAMFRLDTPAPGSAVSVASVVTDLGPTERGLPDADALRANTDLLFRRTEVAAGRGARLVVWNEIATVVTPADEAAFVARGQATADRLNVDLVLGYAVLESEAPVRFDNKFLFISDAGDILDEYQKHHPVPGEPSIRGTGPLKVLTRPYGRIGGAICYDYDFPAMGREHARGGADLVVLPSSDWRGIDPIHTYMARARAIEGGFALVRAVRWAPSGTFDAFGRTRGWMTAIDDNDRVMVVQVPVGQRPTLATRLGDWPVALAGGVVLLLFAAVWRQRT